MPTLKREDEVSHTVEPDDRILNLGQLRSALILLTFRHAQQRYPSPSLSLEQVLEQAMKNRAELDLEAVRQKLLAEQKAAARSANRGRGKSRRQGQGHGRGRGRGRGRGQGCGQGGETPPSSRGSPLPVSSTDLQTDTFSASPHTEYSKPSAQPHTDALHGFTPLAHMSELPSRVDQPWSFQYISPGVPGTSLQPQPYSQTFHPLTGARYQDASPHQPQLFFPSLDLAHSDLRDNHALG